MPLHSTGHFHLLVYLGNLKTVDLKVEYFPGFVEDRRDFCGRCAALA